MWEGKKEHLKKKMQLQHQQPASLYGTVYSGIAIPGWRLVCDIAILNSRLHGLANPSVVDYSHE